MPARRLAMVVATAALAAPLVATVAPAAVGAEGASSTYVTKVRKINDKTVFVDVTYVCRAGSTGSTPMSASVSQGSVSGTGKGSAAVVCDGVRHSETVMVRTSGVIALGASSATSAFSATPPGKPKPLNTTSTRAIDVTQPFEVQVGGISQSGSTVTIKTRARCTEDLVASSHRVSVAASGGTAQVPVTEPLTCDGDWRTFSTQVDAFELAAGPAVATVTLAVRVPARPSVIPKSIAVSKDFTLAGAAATTR